MKEIYEKTKMEIIEFELEDVINTSPTSEVSDIGGNSGISYGGGGNGGAR